MRKQAKGTPSLFSLLVLPYLIVLLVIGGLTSFVYPTAAQWLSQYNYAKLISNYTKELDHIQPDGHEQLAAAHAYNDALSSGAQLLPNQRIPTGSGSFASAKTSIESGGRSWTYGQILSADSSGLMGRIRIPDIDVDLPIYHGADDATLLKGAGHLEGTSLPVGGASTRTVITAHRGLAEAALFTRLNEVKIGDTFSLEVFGDVLVYRVIDTKVVDPADGAAVEVVEGRDLATLVTCTPLGINTHRILVTGERVQPTPQQNLDDAGHASGLPHFPWWLIGYLTALVVVLLWACVQTRDALHPLSARPRHAGGHVT